MTDKTDPRLQLIPPGAKPRLWMFSLCVLLPVAITAASLFWAVVESGPTKPAGGAPIAVMAGLLVLVLAIYAVLDRAMLRHRLQLSPLRLEVKSSFYSRTVALSELKLDEARVVDLHERLEFNPGSKSNGYSVPGFRSGHYRLKNGAKAFVALADERRALWLPTVRGDGLLLQPQQPDALLKRLRELAAAPARR